MPLEIGYAVCLGVYLFALSAFFNSHASLLWSSKCRWFPLQNHLFCTIHTCGIIAKATVSVVTLMLLVIFNIRGMSISRNLCSRVEGRRKDNLWGVVIDLLIESTSDLSFSGLAKHINSYKLKSFKKGI